MDFSPINGPSWGTDEISYYDPINPNMYDIFLQTPEIKKQINNPLTITSKSFPSPRKVQKSLSLKKKEGFIGSVELTDDMLIIILLVILILVSISIHNTVQRVFDSINSLTVLLAATKNNP